MPGIKLYLTWPDATPLEAIRYTLTGPEYREGATVNGWIDERKMIEGSYKLEINGVVRAIRTR
jgi:hypothetical protein